MGTNQFLLIALCFILVGASIRVGLNQYKANEIEQNRIALIGDIQAIAIEAFIYRTKTANLKGGKGSYVGYTLSKKRKTNDAGSYKAAITKDKITLTATSKLGHGTIVVAYDKVGKYVKKSYKCTGTFKK